MADTPWIVATEGDSGTRQQKLIRAFSDVTIGDLPFEIEEKLTTKEDFTCAAVAITVYVAMSFIARIDPNGRAVCAEGFIQKVSESVRGSVQLQNIHDAKPEGQA